jgi:hypothetical protein
MDVVKPECASVNDTFLVSSLSNTQLVEMKSKEHTAFSIVKRESEVSCPSGRLYPL